ncbi:MAG: ATP-dependent DNA helicase RecQ [Myxococcota bacterium]|nr:ATP-dependent DNA helicase RecQ [Myxococcota bacterium]
MASSLLGFRAEVVRLDMGQSHSILILASRRIPLIASSSSDRHQAPESFALSSSCFRGPMEQIASWKRAVEQLESRSAQLEQALEDFFGFSSFQPGQHAIITDVMEGRPTVAVMPTGAGKSLCYQLPAVLLEGVTVVVSPLIALMKDQVDSLSSRGISAVYLNSTQDPTTQDELIEAIANGEHRLVYVAPERFKSVRFMQALSAVHIELFAIDEAHCISRWGHDFRPDYGRLGQVIERQKPSRILACTATATPQVRTDIVSVLNLVDPAIHIAGFLRTNLHLSAQSCRSEKMRERALLSVLSRKEFATGGLILYASTRRRVERIGALCRENLSEPVVIYHGGLDDSERTSAQERFMSGEVRIAVATNAFGMGIDRTDIRGVIHLDLPRTLEGYYQEVGRAGRDGYASHCVLLFNAADRRTHEFLIDLSHPDGEWVADIWGLVAGFGGRSWSVQDVQQLRPRGFENQHVESVFRTLVRVGLAHEEEPGRWYLLPTVQDQHAELAIDFEALAQRRASEYSKLDALCEFIFDPECRHSGILAYFGEQIDALTCPGCDRCDQKKEGEESPLSPEDRQRQTLLIRKALAGVARADGRVGLKRVAGMLAGSRARNVADSYLSRLSTYGILKAYGMDACESMLHGFIERGLCKLSGGRYPTIELSSLGWSVMQARRAPHFELPAAFTLRTPGSRSDHVSTAEDQDPTLIESLRAFRRREAQRRQVPPYVIFTDRTLQAIASKRPTTEVEFLEVKGLGTGKWAQYGPQLLDELARGSSSNRA